MTKDEIAPFARTITYTNNRTVINMKDGTQIVGYFQSNADKKQLDENKWNFVITPQEDPKKETMFNGNDFHSIEIIQLT